MSNIIQESTRSIVGISVRTSNAEAVDTIPAMWGKFYGEGVPDKIDGKVSEDVFAVYTSFENEGQNNEGQYTFLIGVEVETGVDVPAELDIVSIRSGNYHQFLVEENKPENVFQTWMKIWSTPDLNNTYLSDFEQYRNSGDITVNVGTR